MRRFAHRFSGGRRYTFDFKNLPENIKIIRDEMIAGVLENSSNQFKKKLQRHSAGEAIIKSLRLSSVKIYSDLSAEVEFIGKVEDDEDPDESFYALIGWNGKLTEAGISKL